VSRRKNRGYRLPPGKFAAIPIDVLKRASRALSAPELRVWVCLCAQSQPWSNGTANLTRSVIKEFSLGSTRNVTSAIRALVSSGLVKQTRRARQHVCAMYAVTHMSLNPDAMAKHGISATTSEALKDESSETNRGTAGARPTGNGYCDHVGSAEPQNTPSARPQGNRNASFSTIPARPQGTQSKNLPSTTGDSGAANGVTHASDSTSQSAPSGAPNRGLSQNSTG
jgi:hypothetical protein